MLTLSFAVLDFIKQVVENGVTFSKSHFFMLLDNLEASEIAEYMVIRTLRIFIEELGVTELEYVQYQQGLNDPVTQKAYFDIRSMLFQNNHD